MTNAKPKRMVVIGVALYLVVGLAFAEMLAGYAFFFINKTAPNDYSKWGVFLESWNYYRGDPAQHKRLVLALVAALVVVFVIPALMVLAALNRPRELHGSARFASAREITSANLCADKGIILGKSGGKYLIQGGQTFVLLAAPTRSGKGVSVVIPNLLNWPDSVVCLDIKYENFLYTSGFRSQKGQEVYLFAPFNETGETHRWNPLGFVRRGTTYVVDDLNSVAFDLWPDTGDHRTDFWNSLARDQFIGVAGYVDQTPELPFTLAEILRQGTGAGRDVKEHFREILESRSEGNQVLPTYCLDALGRFLGASESGNTGGSIRATFAEPLAIFASPVVATATSACDFDVAQIRRRRMTIYVGIPPNKLALAARILNLFFSQLLNINTKELPQTDPSLRYQCLILADEFTSMGRIGMLSKAVGYMAGYGLRMMPIVQSVAQIRTVYKDETDNFVTNHETQILYAPRENKDATEFSETLGYLTERSQSVNRSRPTGLAKGSGSSGVTTSPQRRALMLPQELRELGDKKEILLIRGVKPILCEKAVYYNDPVFIDRLKSVSASLRSLGNRLPTQHELENAAFLQRDLCIAIPRQSPAVEPRAAAAKEGASIDLSALNVKGAEGPAIQLPPVDDQSRPSKESIDAIVDAFFDQLEWVPDADDTGGTIAAVVIENRSTMRAIDLSVLDS